MLGWYLQIEMDSVFRGRYSPESGEGARGHTHEHGIAVVTENAEELSKRVIDADIQERLKAVALQIPHWLAASSLSFALLPRNQRRMSLIGVLAR
jgi:hypothetical protein